MVNGSAKNENAIIIYLHNVVPNPYNVLYFVEQKKADVRQVACSLFFVQ